ncbi:MAG: TIGR00282 family metallophosphoesterase [Candidatus Omnitrophica bacterium]|nr:TIGR00282 family metallophosphoesterase [Candidatus Omnitrophota bacterium]
MKILCIGDIVGKPGRAAVESLLKIMKPERGIDAVVANVENAASGSGVTSRLAKHFLRMGCDVLTAGDHIWDQKEVEKYLKEEPRLLRPANFPPGAPGNGWGIYSIPGGPKVAVVSLLGRVFMRYAVDCPFRAWQRIYEEIRRETPVIIVDFHGEATSEKIAFGHFVDGQASVVFGTHTHIQTADAQILPKGTAYITDTGMTGPYDSVIGQSKENIIQRFLLSMPVKFTVASGDIRLSGILADIDAATGKARGIERVSQKYEGVVEGAAEE